MPLTVSHPAAAVLFWPLVRRDRLPLSALVIGAMVPDFEYFLHLRPLALWGHSLAGLLTFCIPVGVVVLAVWESIVRAPVRALLGRPGDERREAHGPQWWARATIAIVVGSITHILWDGSTHQGGWGLREFPVLGAVALPVAGHPLIWAGVLDYASTLAGGFVVLAWLGREMHRTDAAIGFAETLAVRRTLEPL